MNDETEGEKRRWPRFKVASLSNLAGIVDKSCPEAKLVVLGRGGCGFYHIEPQRALAPPRRLYLRFQMDAVTESKEIQGNLLYAVDREIGGKKILYYGVQFIESFIPHIEPLLSEIEKLAAEGKVEIEKPHP